MIQKLQLFVFLKKTSFSEPRKSKGRKKHAPAPKVTVGYGLINVVETIAVHFNFKSTIHFPLLFMPIQSQPSPSTFVGQTPRQVCDIACATRAFCVGLLFCVIRAFAVDVMKFPPGRKHCRFVKHFKVAKTSREFKIFQECHFTVCIVQDIGQEKSYMIVIEDLIKKIH